jgi:hypothetical protein
MRHAGLKPYCVRCYAPLDAGRGKCTACGYSNPLSIRQRYWTREPELVQTEIALKVMIFVLTLGAMMVLGLSGRRLGWMAGWTLAVPVFVAFPLWMTASCLTARTALFNPVGFWSAVFVLIGIFLVAFNPWLGIIPLVLIVITVTSGMSFRRWKTDHVLMRQARLARRPDGR